MTDISSVKDVLNGSNLLTEIGTTVRRTVDYIVSTADYPRDDRLWPADPQVFTTNPLSIAYGACGTALFLATADVPDTLSGVADWILRHPITIHQYPPGLYLGLAGVAYTLYEIGVHEKAGEVMERLSQSPLLYAEADMLHGAAGWGWASLYFFEATGEELYLDRAVRAGEYLLHTAEEGREFCFWRCQADGLVHYGFGHGASGIALFLAYLHRVTGDMRYRVAATKAMDFDLSKSIATEHGQLWSRHEKDNQVRSYWIEGASGIGSVAIRLHTLLGIERYRTAALQVAADAFVKHTVSPGLFHGKHSGLAQRVTMGVG